MEDILAAANARAKGAPPPAPAAETKPATETPATPAEDIELKTFTKLTREKRDLETKLKAQEVAIADAQVALEAKKLMGEGKKLEALALLTGKDPTEEMTDLLAAYIAEPGEKTDDDLAKKVDEIAATLANDKKARDDEKKADEDAEAKAVATQAQSMVDRVLTGAAEKFELCARAENREEAIAAAIDGAVHLAGTRKLDLKTLTEAETNALIEEAFQGVETLYEGFGKRYSKAARATTGSAESVARGSVSTVRSTGKPKSMDEILARARERAKYA
jgi:hypothetical protein